MPIGANTFYQKSKLCTVIPGNNVESGVSSSEDDEKDFNVSSAKAKKRTKKCVLVEVQDENISDSDDSNMSKNRWPKKTVRSECDFVVPESDPDSNEESDKENVEKNEQLKEGKQKLGEVKAKGKNKTEDSDDVERSENLENVSSPCFSLLSGISSLDKSITASHKPETKLETKLLPKKNQTTCKQLVLLDKYSKRQERTSGARRQVVPKSVSRRDSNSQAQSLISSVSSQTACRQEGTSDARRQIVPLSVSKRDSNSRAQSVVSSVSSQISYRQVRRRLLPTTKSNRVPDVPAKKPKMAPSSRGRLLVELSNNAGAGSKMSQSKSEKPASLLKHISSPASENTTPASSDLEPSYKGTSIQLEVNNNNCGSAIKSSVCENANVTFGKVSRKPTRLRECKKFLGQKSVSQQESEVEPFPPPKIFNRLKQTGVNKPMQEPPAPKKSVSCSRAAVKKNKRPDVDANGVTESISTLPLNDLSENTSGASVAIPSGTGHESNTGDNSASKNPCSPMSRGVALCGSGVRIFSENKRGNLGAQPQSHLTSAKKGTHYAALLKKISSPVFEEVPPPCLDLSPIAQEISCKGTNLQLEVNNNNCGSAIKSSVCENANVTSGKVSRKPTRLRECKKFLGQKSVSQQDSEVEPFSPPKIFNRLKQTGVNKPMQEPPAPKKSVSCSRAAVKKNKRPDVDANGVTESISTLPLNDLSENTSGASVAIPSGTGHESNTGDNSASKDPCSPISLGVVSWGSHASNCSDNEPEANLGKQAESHQKSAKKSTKEKPRSSNSSSGTTSWSVPSWYNSTSSDSKALPPAKKSRLLRQSTVNKPMQVSPAPKKSVSCSRTAANKKIRPDLDANVITESIGITPYCVVSENISGASATTLSGTQHKRLLNHHTTRKQQSSISKFSATKRSGKNSCGTNQTGDIGCAAQTRVAPTKSAPHSVGRKEAMQGHSQPVPSVDDNAEEAGQTDSNDYQIVVEDDYDEHEEGWRHGDLEEVKFPKRPALQCPSTLKSPIEYFSYYFDDDLINLIVEQTNIYSVQKSGKSLNVTCAEIKAFIGIIIYMGVCNMPATTDYWAGLTKVPQVADVMPRRRYQNIHSHIHFHDNDEVSEDRFIKVRPLLNHLRSKCQKLPHEYDQSVDESMVAYKGTRAGNLRQYLPDKPSAKWGFKMFVRAGASGMIYDFIPYAGSSTFDHELLSQEEIGMGVGAAAVISLCKSIPDPRNSTVTFDNFYTGLRLLVYLKNKMNLHAMGTVRRNRTNGCPLTNPKEFQKNERGTSESFVNKNALVVVQWLDSKPVCLASSCAGVEPMGTARRYCAEKKAKADVPCPRVVEKYNKTMGGVDLADQYMSIYRVPTRSRRWYFALVGFAIELALTNSWILYKRECEILGVTQEISSSKEFRLHISSSLTCSQQKSRGRPSLNSSLSKKKVVCPVVPRPVDELRLDGFHHWPQMGKKNRCRYCKTGFSRHSCTKCNLSLCLTAEKNCFTQFHLERSLFNSCKKKPVTN